MTLSRRSRILVNALVLLALTGCHSHDCFVGDPEGYLPFSQQIEVPHTPPVCIDAVDPADMVRPPSVRRGDEPEKWMMSLDEAIEVALANSQVMRSIGGQLVAAPTTATTVYDPAIREADPRFGVEAALADFDAQFGVRLFHEQQDRAFNNSFLASSGTLTRTSNFRLGIDKTAATGTRFTMENVTTYSRDQNFDANLAFNRFPSVYDTMFLAGFRHPVLQGGGVEFNRIAGPDATPGNYRGVLLARIDTDISIADFETAVRNLVADVERTYWELYFAYRDYNAKQEGLRLALEAWQLERSRVDAGIRSFDQEAFAREQYYAAQADVENALSGTLSGRGGSSGGFGGFGGSGGVYTTERQLRTLLGLPTSDGRLIVPSDEPATVDMQFDWHESLAYALTRRVELRRQQWQIQRRELELIAARNFEMMRLDFVGQYRWRGFGDELFGEEFRPAGSAFASLFDGNLQDWRVGFELSTPVGNRIGHAAARHAELQLVRERSIYEEMEREVAHELRGAFTELDRTYVVSRSQYNRRVATQIRLRAEQQRNAEGQTDLDLVLDAQRQSVAAESGYHRAIVEYNLALMNMHFTRGTLLDRHGVVLAEGAWSDAAHRSAAKLAREFWEDHNYCLTIPGPVSAGAYPQRVEGGHSMPAIEPAPAEELPLPRTDY